MTLGVLVADGTATMISTQMPSPKNVPFVSSMRHVPFASPGVLGAIIGTEIVYDAWGLTAMGRVTLEPPIGFPLMSVNLKPACQAQLPVF